MIDNSLRFLLHELHKIGDEKLRPFADTLTNNVSTISDEAVGWRRAFKVGRTVSNHHDIELSVGLQLTRVEVSDLSDCFAFSAASACRLVHIKSTIISLEVEKQLVGEQIVERNIKLLRNGINERMETSRDKVDFLIFRSQMINEIPEKKRKTKTVIGH